MSEFSVRTPNPGPLQTPRWLHIWAIVTVLATIPLLMLGAEVTTKKVGMVDPVGFREPWHLAHVWQEGTLAERGLGYLIEHSHRIAGFVVGICAIILAAGLWFAQRRRGLKWMGLAGLLAVSAQGVLGIFRVNLNAILGPGLALIHGCTAQLVFALLVSIAVFTSRRWFQPAECFKPEVFKKLKWLSLGLLALIYLQLVLGALVRHTGSPHASRVHLIMASVVAGGIVWLLREWFGARRLTRVEKTAGFTLMGCLFIQLLLGVEAWLSKFQVMDRLTTEKLEPIALPPDLLRSFHFVMGAFVFGATLVVTLLIFRHGALDNREIRKPINYSRELEGVV